MSSQKISFEVMVISPEVLEEAINQHNYYHKTDFHITKTYDNLSSCIIDSTSYTIEDVFNLGYRLSVIEHRKKSKGELDW